MLIETNKGGRLKAVLLTAFSIDWLIASNTQGFFDASAD